jgi:hypothetical protein
MMMTIVPSPQNASRAIFGTALHGIGSPFG